MVGTIVDDMTTDSRRRRKYLGYHVSAALQYYHDIWMCSVGTGVVEEPSSPDLQRKKCDYHEWMYKSDEEVQEYITAGTSSCDGNTDVGSVINGLTKEQESHPTLDEDQQESTCNDGLYWDLWSYEDRALKSVQYSRIKAEMLWKHVAQVLL